MRRGPIRTEFKRYLRPEELCPPGVRPPDVLIEAACKALPEVLLDMYKPPEEDKISRLVRLLQKQGHSSTVSEWAIYEHVREGRVAVEIRTCSRHYLLNDEGGSLQVSTPNEDTIEVEDEYQVIPFTLELKTWWEQNLSGDSASPEVKTPFDTRANPMPGDHASQSSEDEGFRALDEECRSALRHYGKAVDTLHTLSPARKFYLVCLYWKDVEDMTPAQIRDQFIEKLNSGAYHLPGKESGRSRVKTALRRGKELLERL